MLRYLGEFSTSRYPDAMLQTIAPWQAHTLQPGFYSTELWAPCYTAFSDLTLRLFALAWRRR